MHRITSKTFSALTAGLILLTHACPRLVAENAPPAPVATDSQSVEPPLPTPPPSAEAILVATMQGTLKGRASRSKDKKLLKSVAAYYAAHAYAPIWFNQDATPRPQIQILLDRLSKSFQDGLQVDDYAVVEISRKVKFVSDSPLILCRTDLDLSLAFVRFAKDIATGRVDPKSVTDGWYIRRPTLDLKQLLSTVATSTHTDFQSVLDNLEPKHPQYQRLKTALADYRARSISPVLPTVPPLTKPLKPGTPYPHAPLLRERLIATNHLASDSPPGDPYYYTPQLSEAVMHFQQFNASLEVDGVLGPATLKALNAVNPLTQLQRIIINMDRWRWMPTDLGKRYILVNVPEFELRAYNNNLLERQLHVVVGKSLENRNTPLFSEVMRYVIFNPFWNVPYSIAKNEMVGKGADYLIRNDYEITGKSGTYGIGPDTLAQVANGNLQLRQRGGSGNALGRVKFLFPNKYAVYLHDTPSKHLFSRRKRSFSHGCIRVQHPERLAAFVLQDNQGWTIDRIDKTMYGGKRKSLTLKTKIPVYISYWTVTVAEDGKVVFHDDIYNYDRPLLQAHTPTHIIRAATPL